MACAEHVCAADGHAVVKRGVPHPRVLVVGQAWVGLAPLLCLVARGQTAGDTVLEAFTAAVDLVAPVGEREHSEMMLRGGEGWCIIAGRQGAAATAATAVNTQNAVTLRSLLLCLTPAEIYKTGLHAGNTAGWLPTCPVDKA